MSSSLSQLVAAVNTWRDSLNPLRNLTISRAVAMLEAGQRGQLADLQWTYEFIEQTDSDLVAIVERTLSAIGEMDWQIKTVPKTATGFDPQLGADQARALRGAYERIDNIKEAIEHASGAHLRGFAIMQPHCDPAGEVAHLECLNPWNFARLGRAGQWVWNPEAKDVAGENLPSADRLDPQEIIVHEVRRPVDRLGLVKFIRSSSADKDWDAYVEIYGIPAWILIGPPNVPTDKESQYQEAAERIAEGGSGYLPNGSDAKSAATQAGQQPFNPRLQYLTEKLVLAATGGLLTMLTASGSGTLAGSAHMEAFRTIARYRAGRISELFQRRIDRAILDARFPGKPRLAYFEISAKETQSVSDTIKDVTALATQFELDPAEISERTGYKILGAKPPPPVPAPFAAHSESVPAVLSPASAIADRTARRLEDATRIQAAQAMAQDLAPLRARIEAALAHTDDAAMIDSLRQIPAEGPDLLRKIIEAPALEQVLDEAQTAALLNGLAEGAAAHSPSQAQASASEASQA